MSIRKETPSRYIEKLNKILSNNDVSSITPEMAEKYFDNFRLVFKEFLHAIDTALDRDTQQKLRFGLCKNNALFAIQLKLNYELPPDLYEIAYDFDNPDYPRLDFIVKKIKHREYIIQQQSR